MTGASIETTLELWASSLREVKIRMRPLFAQERAALNAGLFVDGLPSVVKPDGCARRQRAQKNQVERNAKTSDLIPWSIQEVRRIAQRLARKRIQPADVIAWSLWRRAHQAAAQKSHLKQKLQL